MKSCERPRFFNPLSGRVMEQGREITGLSNLNLVRLVGFRGARETSENH